MKGLSIGPISAERWIVFLILFLIPLLLTSCKKKNETPLPEEDFPSQWKVSLPVETYYGSPALSNDGKTVYIGTSTGFYGQHKPGQEFVALDAATGTEKWHLDLGSSEMRSAPAVAPDNSIYFAVDLRDQSTSAHIGDELYKVSASGNLVWEFNINASGLDMDIGLSAPAIGKDGTVYIAGDKLYAIGTDGISKWTAFGTTGEMLRNSPVISKYGTVYFVYHNIPLTALNPDDGSVKWTCQLGVNDHCFASPAIGDSGIIYIATQPGLLYAVKPSGQIKWTFDIGSVGFTGTMRCSPAIDSAGTVYFGINYGNPVSAFFAVKRDGTLKWKFEPSDLPSDVPPDHFDIYSSPAIGTGGIIYFGQEFGRVYGLNMNDGSIAGIVTTSSGITWPSPAIDEKGILYINDLSGKVYAFKTKSSGLDTTAPWPKYRYGNQNNGLKH